MDQRRLLVSSFLFLVIYVGWFAFGPKWFPKLFPQKIAPNAAVAEVEDGENAVVENADAPKAGDGGPAASEPGDGAPKADQLTLPDFPTKSVTLGSTDPTTGYALTVELSTVGAAVQCATLNDARYPIAENPAKLSPVPQLRVVGNNIPVGDSVLPFSDSRRAMTFDVQSKVVDAALRKLNAAASLKTINWELVEPLEFDSDNKDVIAGATFRLPIPGLDLELRKRFVLNRVLQDGSEGHKLLDTDAAAYQLDMSLQLRNTGDEAREMQYVLQGPVGLPLENADIARKFRDIKAGFLADSGTIDAKTITASEIEKATDKNDVETLGRPVKFIGVDVQYFAALLVPADDQLKKPYFSSIVPSIVVRGKVKSHSDISLELTSTELTVPADGVVDHRFKLYLGPKRRDLLNHYGADSIIDFGWFAFISHGMVALMQTFHSWGVPYGLAIIMLTVMVRGCMFPVSRKQAASGRKMKELQPLLTELREKYKDDKQGMAQAQMELYRKANFNPFAGCLPVFLQLPIFIALYQALNNYVDLRMAPFLWISDLSAPDRLFVMPFALPFLGSDFNLLPLITMALFYLQQKMFMPPATSPEQEMQQKMMSYMMIVMGFLFYHVPAGLCVYFIASSCWGMSERKLLELLPEKAPPPEELNKPRKESFLTRLMQQVQQAADMQEQLKARREENDQDDSRSDGQPPSRRGGNPRPPSSGKGGRRKR